MAFPRAIEIPICHEGQPTLASRNELEKIDDQRNHSVSQPDRGRDAGNAGRGPRAPRQRAQLRRRVPTSPPRPDRSISARSPATRGRASAPLHPHRGTICPRAIPAMPDMPPIRPIRCGDTDRYTPASLLEQGSQSSVRRPRRGGRLVMSPKASDIGAGLIAAFG